MQRVEPYIKGGKGVCMGESLFLEEEPHLLQENPPSLHVKIFISTSQLSPELALKEKKKKSLGMALLTFDLKKKNLLSAFAVAF